MSKNKAIFGLLLLIPVLLLLGYGNGVYILSPLESNGAIPVNIQDQHTDAIIFKFNKIDASTTIAANALIDTRRIKLTSMDSVSVGDYLIAFNPDSLRFYKGNVLSISVDTVTMDSPLDWTMPAGTFIDITQTNLAVIGGPGDSTKVFGLRGVSPSPVGESVDITRIIFSCQTVDAVDLSKFGDIEGGLTNGIVLRVRNDRYYNIFNVKTNAELAGILYDWQPQLATNPSQGQDGFIARLTFGGQNKVGVTIRLDPGEDLELLVQDDLSSITLLEIIAEGHIVTD